MKKKTPLIIGAITGLLMAGLSYLMFSQRSLSDSGVYILYALYLAGIGLSLFLYSRSPGYTPKFGSIFSEGFRCFIMVTLVMVVYTFAIGNMHPEIAEENATNYKAALVKEHSKTPPQIEELYQQARKGYVTSVVYSVIFTTLISGCFFTAIGAGVLLMRRK